MNSSRTLTPVCSLLATALLALAQTPPPRAAAAPMPPDAWEQTPAPRPAAAPMAPMDIDQGDIDAQISLAKELTLSPELRDQIEAAKEQVGRMRLDIQERARDMARAAQLAPFAFAPQSTGMSGARPPTPPMPPKVMTLRGMSDDRLYSSGQSALDNRHWDQALESFSQVISRNGSRVDGALYWKAYALGRLGRRDEATAAIAELRKSYAASRWLDDAKVLELELKQASGQNVSPEAESDEELKLMAINGLMQSDPERAIPLLEG